MAESLADLLLRDPEFVGQRRPSVARPVKGQPFDLEFLRDVTERPLDLMDEGVVGSPLFDEPENVIRAGVPGDDLGSFRLDEDRHRVDVLARSLRPHEVCPAVAQPVEMIEIHQVHAAHVERQQKEIPGCPAERVGRLVGDQPLELLFGERLLVFARGSDLELAEGIVLQSDQILVDGAVEDGAQVPKMDRSGVDPDALLFEIGVECLQPDNVHLLEGDLFVVECPDRFQSVSINLLALLGSTGFGISDEIVGETLLVGSGPDRRQ